MTKETSDNSTFNQVLIDLYQWKLDDQQTLINREASEPVKVFLGLLVERINGSEVASLQNTVDTLLSSDEFSDAQKEIPTLSEIARFIDGLFDFFSEKGRIVKAFSQQTLRLKPLFYKLAILDYRLLSGKNQIGKLLLNRLARIGASLSNNSPLISEVETILDSLIKSTGQLNQLEPLNAKIEKSYQQLNNFLAGIEKKAKIFEKRSREIAAGQSKANAAKSWVKSNLNTVYSSFNLPAYIKDFIHDSLQHLIFLEKLKESPQSEKDCLSLVKKLALSLKPVDSEKDLEILTQIQLSTIDLLRPELEKTSLVEIEANALLRNIEDDFKKTIEFSNANIEENSKEEIIRLKPRSFLEIESESNLMEEHSENNTEELSIDEWAAVQLETAMANAPNKVQESMGNQEATNASEDVNEMLSWKEGDWFDIRTDNSVSRCKLASIISESQMYIFVDFQGVKVFESNFNELERLIDSKKIRKIKSRPSFESALKNTLNKTLAEQQEKIEEEKRQAKLARQEEIRRQQEALKKEQELLRMQKEREAAIEEAILKVKSMAVGSWAQVEKNGQVKKCKFAARIASSNKYIFTDRSGIKILEPTLQELAAMVVDNKIELTIENDMFGKALASVITKRRGDHS